MCPKATQMLYVKPALEIYVLLFLSYCDTPFSPICITCLILALNRYVWPNMKTHIQLWSRSCIQCQKAKIGRHTQTPVDPFSFPDEQFEHVHINITGPLRSHEQYKYLLMCVVIFRTGAKSFQWQILIPMPQQNHLSQDGYPGSAVNTMDRM